MGRTDLRGFQCRKEIRDFTSIPAQSSVLYSSMLSTCQGDYDMLSVLVNIPIRIAPFSRELANCAPAANYGLYCKISGVR